MDELDYEILAIVKQQPEHNPDGSPFKMQIGTHAYTKAEILEGWEKDPDMRKKLRSRILSLKLHVLSRGTPE